MENFIYCNPTKILFGKGQIFNLGSEIKNYSNKILFVYGGESIRKNGVYNEVLKQLNRYNIIFFELSGVVPNPRISLITKGIEICREKGIGFILAVGGGSTIDTAKTIAAAVKYDGDPWDLFVKRIPIKEALPIGTVLTIAATGSEMNDTAVITNWEKHEKRMISAEALYPKFSILDPECTYTVPNNQTVFGSIDIMIHLLEQYFHHDQETMVQDVLCEGLLKTVIKYLTMALKDPEDYNARANLMWASSLALNGLIGSGVISDWTTHRIGQEISAIYDIPHGESLAIVWPHWAKYVMEEGYGKFKQYATNVWGANDEHKTDKEIAIEGIDMTEKFFSKMGVGYRLNYLKIYEKDIEIIAGKVVEPGPVGNFKKLYKEDVIQILKKCFYKD
ncbi:MAG: alcohol dehydrogenase [Thermoanaerobacteraceae bacterium]|jgi:hypothetical protein|nr:alcohol dehydrogenase [Thermoanaerobacteraceae bacterium]